MGYCFTIVTSFLDSPFVFVSGWSEWWKIKPTCKRFAPLLHLIQGWNKVGWKWRHSKYKLYTVRWMSSRKLIPEIPIPQIPIPEMLITEMLITNRVREDRVRDNQARKDRIRKSRVSVIYWHQKLVIVDRQHQSPLLSLDLGLNLIVAHDFLGFIWRTRSPIPSDESKEINCHDKVQDQMKVTSN